MSAAATPRAAGAAALSLVSLAAGVAYLFGAAPGIQIWDTAELAAAAYRLGPSHPPGQPLYALAGKLVTLLPLGSIAFRANLLSAASAALAVWLTGLLASRWAVRAGVSSGLVGPLAALAFAASGPLVNQATRAEVYAPAVALFLLAAVAVTRAVLDERVPLRPLAAAGLAAGLAATLHPAAGLSAGVAGLAAVAVLRPRLLAMPRVWLATLGSLLLGVSPLALIALRCRGDLEPCWEAHMTPARFFAYVSGATFRHNVQTGGAAWTAVAEAMRFTLVRVGIVPALVALVAAGVASRRGGARVVLALLVATAVPFLFVVMQAFHPDNPDTQGYLLPAFALLLAAALVAALVLGRARRALGTVLALGAATAAIAAGDARASLRPRAYLAGDVGAQALGEPRPKALVVAGSDAVFFAMQYGQLVEGGRPDVALMASGLSSTFRQWDDAARRRPEIVLARVRPRGEGENSMRYARGALDLVAGVLPRSVEDPLFDVEHARATGVLFGLDGQERAAPMPHALAREHERRLATYADGTDAMMRLLYLRRSFDREAHGEIGAAVHEVLGGLWEERRALRRLLADFEPARVLRVRPLTPLGYQGWIADAGTLRAVLARLVYRGGRTDLAVAVLERDFRGGNAQAALVLAELELREGRVAEAEAIYRAFAAAHPDRRGYAEVGLALARASRGDRAGAERLLARMTPGDDPVLRLWATDVAQQIIPALAP